MNSSSVPDPVPVAQQTSSGNSLTYGSSGPDPFAGDSPFAGSSTRRFQFSIGSMLVLATLASAFLALLTLGERGLPGLFY